MPTLYLGDEVLPVEAGESILQTLLRHRVEVSYSCRVGTCQTCMMRCEDGQIPEKARAGLRASLVEQGYFLACICHPEQDLTLRAPNDADLFGRARVVLSEPLGPTIHRLVLRPATPLYYHAGQFMNLRRHDGLVRSYSLASVPRLQDTLEFHVKRLPRGQMSNWICDALTPGEELDIEGPNGACFYVAGQPEQSMLLIGNGTGLAPLIGIARDALHSGHRGQVHLYHGSRSANGLYLRDDMLALKGEFDNFHYHGCISGDEVPEGFRAGRAEAVAFADHEDLEGWRVFLCGYPPMVASARKLAYLSGAELSDIYADPFDLQDLREQPRE